MLTVKIETDNAAFGVDAGGAFDETARILRIVAGKVSSGQESGSCFDSNGNRVGSFELSGQDDDERG